MRKLTLWILCAIVLLSFCLPVTAAAVSIDPEKDASMTLVYKHEGFASEGLQIEIFRVADVKDDFEIVLAGDFADYPVKVYDVSSQAEWNKIYKTLESYIWADGIVPTASAVTDADGVVKFEGLTPGMYLTMPAADLSDEGITEYFGFLTVIPNRGEAGKLDYHVTAYPKSSSFVPTDDDFIPIRVVKQWKDSGYQEFRPKFIKVDIHRNGDYVTSVNLSAENNWSYGWVVPADGAVWTAVEREIAPEYTVTIEETEGTIILTNVRDDPPPPPTGEASVLWPYILFSCLSGCILILLSLKTKKASA